MGVAVFSVVATVVFWLSFIYSRRTALHRKEVYALGKIVLANASVVLVVLYACASGT